MLNGGDFVERSKERWGGVTALRPVSDRFFADKLGDSLSSSLYFRAEVTLASCEQVDDENCLTFESGVQNHGVQNHTCGFYFGLCHLGGQIPAMTLEHGESQRRGVLWVGSMAGAGLLLFAAALAFEGYNELRSV